MGEALSVPFIVSCSRSLPIQCFRMVANRCLKMRGPVNVKEGGRFVVVVCNMLIELQQWQK